MKTLVIDASIAVKWVVEEEGTPQALRLLQRSKLIAPELLVAECANILWKKVRRDELSNEEALLAARLPQSADIELTPFAAGGRDTHRDRTRSPGIRLHLSRPGGRARLPICHCR